MRLGRNKEKDITLTAVEKATMIVGTFFRLEKFGSRPKFWSTILKQT